MKSGTEIGHSLEFDFVVPLNHCVLLDNPKTIERLGLLSQPLFYFYIKFLTDSNQETVASSICFLACSTTSLRLV